MHLIEHFNAFPGSRSDLTPHQFPWKQFEHPLVAVWSMREMADGVVVCSAGDGGQGGAPRARARRGGHALLRQSARFRDRNTPYRLLARTVSQGVVFPSCLRCVDGAPPL